MADDRLYIKVHNGMPDHPKIEPLSDAAFRLLVSLWCWCDRHDTDGKVTLPLWSRRGTAKTRRELLDAALAQLDADHVQLHDYLEHQRSAAQKLAAKERAASAGRAGGLAKAKRTASKSLDDSASKNVAELDVEVEKEKNPPKPPQGGKRKTAAAPPPEKFDITGEMQKWAAEHAPDVRLVVESARLVDWARGKGERKVDWTAAWRNWMSRAQENISQQRQREQRFDLASGDEEWMR